MKHRVNHIRINLSSDKFRICQGMKNNLVSSNGLLSKVITSSPNGLETNSFPMFNSLATILSYCLYDRKIYSEFLQLCSIEGEAAESNLEALLNLAQHPFHNAAKIYDLVKGKNQTFAFGAFERAAAPGGIPIVDATGHSGVLPRGLVAWNATVLGNFETATGLLGTTAAATATAGTGNNNVRVQVAAIPEERLKCRAVALRNHCD